MNEPIRALISGRVQGVCFRAATAERARELGVQGWVRNLADGRVEVLAAASDDTALATFREWLHEGPPAARVEQVRFEAAADERLPDDVSIR